MRGHRRSRSAAIGAILLVVVWTVAVGATDHSPAPVPIRLGSDARIDHSAFRVTTFASGLPYPTAMQALPDGSLLVAVNESGATGFIGAAGKLLRLTDADDDGVAERIEPIGVLGRSVDSGPLVFQDIPGAIVTMQRIGDLLVVVSRQPMRSIITVMREAAETGGPYESLGSFELAFPLVHLHDSYALALREAQTEGVTELYLNIGSRLNASTDGTPVRVTGLIETELEPESIQRFTLVDDGAAVVVSDVRLVARGLRNAAGLAFHPGDGDLFVLDNGIDGIDDPNEPLSADELDVIPVQLLGIAVLDFGFPSAYVEYRTGVAVGSGAVEPLIAFQPLDGSEAEGAAAMTFAPPGFPTGLNEGLFVGFHGRWSQAGLDNEENPLLYVDPSSGDYFEFVPNELDTVGHLDNVLATEDSLFMADLSRDGTLFTADATGAIYQVKAVSSGQ